MMLIPLMVFIVVTAALIGGYAGVMRLPEYLAARRLDRRLQDVSKGVTDVDPASTEESVLKLTRSGPFPALDRLMASSGGGLRLSRLIEQSGVRITPSAVGLKKFEEQFPEALDLLARAIRAGHAFQTALGMVADELREPVGPEFKKTFDQQNFGLPLRDALNEMAARIAILDVRFFVTAVLIQRDTGGNLSEILDNLAHVVRERFKIRRQIRVHTAHGRFTGFVLLALPAALGIALSFINPEHMQTLFNERMGQMMLMGAIVMQAVGFVWIRQVIKIEV